MPAEQPLRDTSHYHLYSS